MAHLLFPGRHLLNTTFQENYLKNVLQTPIHKLEKIGDFDGEDEYIDTVIFVVTSANQEHSRYNPIPFHIRAICIDRFAQKLKETSPFNAYSIGIPHFPPTDRFAQNTLKEVHEQLDGMVTLEPSNTLVLCSTESVVKLYREQGFSVLPAEMNSTTGAYKTTVPINILEAAAQAGDEWEKIDSVTADMTQTTIDVWKENPHVVSRIQRIWYDPLLTEEGDLTGSRNYSTYALGMSHKALLSVKYNDIKNFIVSGKIVDEGCADGALLVPIAKDFPDADLIGIEITGEFKARFKERQRTGEYGGSFVYVHQRNLMEPIFADDSIDTTICNSTTHELWSYGEQEKTVQTYLDYKFQQLRSGGRLIIRDVVGPGGKNEEVHVWFDNSDGANENIHATCDSPEALKEHLDGLSTRARFYRFAEDFLADMRQSGRRGQETKIQFREEIVGDISYIILSLKDTMEFLSKKDYTDNWKSELNEEFAFWSFSEWKQRLAHTGFRIIENPNTPAHSSRAYANPWIVENRFAGKATLYKKEADGLHKLTYPATNMVLVGEKPG